jgi:hypothetical protein
MTTEIDVENLVPVLVVWHDAHTEEGWTYLEAVDPEPYVVNSLGYLAPDAKPGHLVLVQSICPKDGQVDCVLSIPTGMVVSCTALQ